MAPDNTLQDCDGIAEGSAIDSEIIQDYKKGNQMHLQMNPNKTSKKVLRQFRSMPICRNFFPRKYFEKQITFPRKIYIRGK
jgi:hypothetical protein